MEFTLKHRANTHARLLRLASRYLKRQGPERLGVAKLMHSAGLTHGSFHTYFASKEALLLAALEGAFNEAEQIYHQIGDDLPPRQALTRFIDFYLSAYHRDSPSNCPIVTLNSDLPRQSRKFRTAFNRRLTQLLGILAGWIEGAGISDSKTTAAATLSTMAGAMAVARAISDNQVSGDLLSVVSNTLKAQLGLGDLATVVKVSQALSREIELDKLINTLMGLALEHAGADRGLLILPGDDGLRIEAEAKAVRDALDVRFRQARVAPRELPESVLRDVIRTQDSVLLDDAAGQSPYSEDTYIRENQCRSIVCLPLTTLGNLAGVLYLENNLTRQVFTSARIAVLKLLASQAAIALQNARLYRDLAEREAKIRRLVDANIIGVFIFGSDGRIIDANERYLSTVGYSREDLVSDRMNWQDLTPAEWRAADDRQTVQLRATGTCQPYEKEYFHKSGRRVPVLIGAAVFEGRSDEGVGFVLDLTDRRRAEAAASESEQRYREVQMELAHANRVATMGQLTASIAHEVNQPIAAAMANANAALRWLRADPPNLEKVEQSLDLILKSGVRAGDVVDRVRMFAKKAPPRKDRLHMNEAIREVVELTRGEAAKNGVSVRMDLVDGLPIVEGDKVPLQQVILNLIVNAIEAMSGVSDGERQLLISTREAHSGGALVSVGDSGPGLDSASIERVFETFYTTKPAGLGMGLSICRSIVEAHGGRLWVTANQPRGAVFHFTVPVH
jgi:PAS domain S-box-containing protein